MSAVLIAPDELTYERRFHQDTIRKAKEFRQSWIDKRRDELLRNPFDLLCDMNNSNTLLRGVIDAVGNGSVSALREASVNLSDDLHQYATEVAEHQFCRGRHA